MGQQSSAPDMSALGQLVPVTDINIGGTVVPTCNARELHAYLEVKRFFANWIKGRIAKYGFAEGVDYTTEVIAKSGKNPTGGRPELEYHLTLDMAKELAMVENNPMGRQVRRYFIECERRSIAQRNALVNVPAPTDPAWAAWLSLSTDERRTRQRDVLIYRQAYGSPGMRIAMLQVGMALPPAWAIGAREQMELDMLHRNGVTVTVNVPSVAH